MITVYRWDMRSWFQLDSDGVGWSETGFRVGHVSVEVTGGSPAGAAYMSWSPVRKAMQAPARVGLTLQGDSAVEHGPPIQRMVVGTPTRTLDETRMKAWWADLQRKPPEWVLYDTNCAQLVVDAMRAGGADAYLPAGLIGLWQSRSVVWRPWTIPDYVAAVNRGLAAG